MYSIAQSSHLNKKALKAAVAVHTLAVVLARLWHGATCCQDSSGVSLICSTRFDECCFLSEFGNILFCRRGVGNAGFSSATLKGEYNKIAKAFLLSAATVSSLNVLSSAP